MKRFLLGVVLVATCAVMVVRVSAARRQEPVRPDIMVGPVQVGGLTPEEAQRALRVWWETEKAVRLKVNVPGHNVQLPDMKPGQLGVTLDDAASVRDLDARAVAGAQSPTRSVAPIFRSNGLSLEPLKKALRKALGPDHPARVLYDHGTIIRRPGVAGVELDEAALPDQVGKAVLGDHTVSLPLKSVAPISEDTMGQITDVVATYSTRFPTYRRTRCSNIKLAAQIINGTVVMPGERFSFNGVVGRRTLKAGFKVAGVYINGQHDTGIGGGICQVSTTLYNAALLADLAIRRRSNHSLPVPYVPLGRDATVDYGNLDLVFENTYSTPIAVTSEYHPGELTFRILGKKTNGLSVKIVRGPLTWEATNVEHVQDSSLMVGQKRVLKPGSAYRSVRTLRVIYVDGKVVKRESLGRSQYGGQPRVVAVGTKPPAPAAPIPPSSTVTPTPVVHGG